jgi:DNA-binding ferritin-like protein
MQDLAIQFRAAQLYTHNAHHQIKGITFFADHKFLASAYEAYTEAYDAIIERMIGTDIPYDLNEILTAATDKVLSYPNTLNIPSTSIFNVILDIEKSLCDTIDSYGDEYSTGTINLIAQFADDSEVRQYKIRQRIK